MVPADRRLVVPTFDLWQRMGSLPFFAFGVYLLYLGIAKPGLAEMPTWLCRGLGGLFTILFGSAIIRGGHVIDAEARKVTRWLWVGLRVPIRRWTFDEFESVLLINRATETGRSRFPFELALKSSEGVVPLKRMRKAEQAKELAAKVANLMGLEEKQEMQSSPLLSG